MSYNQVTTKYFPNEVETKDKDTAIGLDSVESQTYSSESESKLHSILLAHMAKNSKQPKS